MSGAISGAALVRALAIAAASYQEWPSNTVSEHQLQGGVQPVTGSVGVAPRRDELRAAGREARGRCPRSSLGEWRPHTDRADPIELLQASNRTRLPELVPVRHERMLESPFAYFRGSPMTMASDLGRTATTGIRVQLCGDAHLMNFGTYATPERNLVFDVNDFDETQPGPWEWDLKRLAASVVVAARTAGLSDHDGVEAVRTCAAEYRQRMSALAEMSAFDVWHSRVDVETIIALAPTKQTERVAKKTATAARRRTSLQALSKLTELRDGRRVIVEDPPLVVRLGEEQVAQVFRFGRAYRDTLEPDRRVLLDRYEFVDAALKVVGVGSVGTRCYIVLLEDATGLDPLFLQVKEAQASVLAPYTEPSVLRNEGQRVVVGQRITQAASDPFLGWARADGFDTYVRQLRDMKGSLDLDAITGRGLADYARLCGAALARGHARSGEPALLAGYLGRSPALDDALGHFAVAYADQTERDYEAFVTAVRKGQLEVASAR